MRRVIFVLTVPTHAGIALVSSSCSERSWHRLWPWALTGYTELKRCPLQVALVLSQRFHFLNPFTLCLIYQGPSQPEVLIAEVFSITSLCLSLSGSLRENATVWICLL